MNDELNKIVDDIHKYKLDNLDSSIIKKVKYRILKDIVADKEELAHFYRILNEYRYIDEVDEIRIGSYIRFFNIKKHTTLELMRGGFICELRPTNNDILIVCKNGIRFFNLRMNECIIFQKNTKEEKILIEIIDHLKIND